MQFDKSSRREGVYLFREKKEETRYTILRLDRLISPAGCNFVNTLIDNPVAGTRRHWLANCAHPPTPPAPHTGRRAAIRPRRLDLVVPRRRGLRLTPVPGRRRLVASGWASVVWAALVRSSPAWGVISHASLTPCRRVLWWKARLGLPRFALTRVHPRRRPCFQRFLALWEQGRVSRPSPWYCSAAVFSLPASAPRPVLAGLEDLIPVSLSITLAPSSLGLPPAASPPALNGVCYDWCAAAGISPRVGVFVAAWTSRQHARRRHPLAAGGSATWRRCCAPAAGGPVHVGSDGASAQGPWPDPAQA